MYVALNNTEVFSVVVDTQQWVQLALLPIYKIFRTAVNNNKP
jgi:hypothetical protein